ANISERLNLYSKLDNVKSRESLEKLVASIVDRFGPLPPEVQQLVEIVKLRWDAQEMGFEKLTIKRETMKGYLPAENNEKYFQGEAFGRILSFVQSHSKTARLKESKDKLIVIFDNVKTIKAARGIFAELLEKR
ncbi:MAG TPA: TRCF domain-containing protein, partial [Adhaeribacter sp.]|nr:TRCF domain-containing protein [Adhaeribacter sp.]